MQVQVLLCAPNFIGENAGKAQNRTDSAQETPESEPEKPMKYPVKLTYRGKVLAKIYNKKPHYPFYRLAYSVQGKRIMKHFKTYSEAKREGDKTVKDLAKGSQAALLTARQAADALLSFERLQSLFIDTGKRFSLPDVVAQFAEAVKKLGDRPLGEAIDGFLRTVATVQRKTISQAVEEFIKAEEPRTRSIDGRRPEISPKYAYNRAIALGRFAGAFPNTAVCDLSISHINAFMAKLGDIKSKSRNRKPVTSPKSRNHQRACMRQFLDWAVRRDYLQRTHRLLEADGMKAQTADEGEIEFYTPAELKALLDAAEGTMRVTIAIGALAGLRTAEILRLDYADLWRVENHIEVSSAKSKNRQRRLVEIVPALAKWLEPFRNGAGKVCDLAEITWQQHFNNVCEAARVEIKGEKQPVARKRNGLRHSFCTFHFALHGNENLTAQQAGNSPAMIHRHYKGLATKKEAEAWFAVSPEQAANVIPMPATTIKSL